MSLLIKNAILNDVQKDILILDGKFSKIAQNIDVPAEKILDAGGKYIVPSLKNGHSHSITICISIFQ